jgi:phosphate uptake regulator
MRRKIVKLGPATLVTSLPSKWAKQFSLKAGDEVDMDEQGNTLIISTKKETKGKEVKLHISQKDKVMGRSIHGPYRFGADKLTITFDDAAVMPKIKGYLDELLGFEITNQAESSVTIEMVAKGMEEEFDKILRRTFLLILTMAKELPQAIKEQDSNKIDELIALEGMVNKLAYFLQRMLNSKTRESVSKTNLLFVMAWNFELIADDLREACKLAKRDVKACKGIMPLLEDFYSYYRLFYENYYEKKEESTLKLSAKYKSLSADIELFFEKSRLDKEKRILGYITSALDKINHLEVSLV